jgi:hypothetical protein
VAKQPKKKPSSSSAKTGKKKGKIADLPAGSRAKSVKGGAVDAFQKVSPTLISSFQQVTKTIDPALFQK